MSIRDQLAKVIAVALTETNPSGLRAFDELSPNRQKQLLSRGGHAADTILARYAVVELPERTDDRWVDGAEGCEMSGWEIETGPHYVSVFHPNEIEISYRGEPDEPVRPAYARALAAALLAAANRAEAQS